MTYVHLILRFSFITFFYFTIVSCDNRDSRTEPLFPHSHPLHYFNHTSTITVEVHYEPEAAPFDDQHTDGTPLWAIAENNLKSLFAYRASAPLVTVPNELALMNLIPPQAKRSWSEDDVLELFSRHHFQKSTSSSSVFYIYFINGHSNTGRSTIGINVKNTPVIAIFKDVIRSSGSLAVQRYSEQAAIVHELGRALGLSDHGLQFLSNNDSARNKSISVDSDCIMYWANEEISSLQSFVTKHLNSPRAILWGAEVLTDAEEISR